MSGKGHAPRPYDATVFGENYDRIFRRPNPFVKLDEACKELAAKHAANEKARARELYLELSKDYEP